MRSATKDETGADVYGPWVETKREGAMGGEGAGGGVDGGYLYPGQPPQVRFCGLFLHVCVCVNDGVRV